MKNFRILMIGMMMLTMAAFASASLNDKVMHYWPLTNFSVTDLNGTDFTAYAMDALVNATIPYPPDSYAYIMDGAGGKFYRTAAGIDVPQWRTFQMRYAIYAHPGAGSTLIAYNDDYADFFSYAYISADDNCEVSGYSVEGYQRFRVPCSADSAWHTFTAALNGTAIRVYVDGVFANETSGFTANTGTSNYQFSVGDAGGNPPGNWSVSEVIIFSSYLSDAEVNQTYYEHFPYSSGAPAVPVVSWVSPAGGSTFTGGVNLTYSVDALSNCTLSENASVVTTHNDVTGSDFFAYSPAANSSYSSSFSVDCVSDSGSGNSGGLVVNFNTLYIVPVVLWDGQEPKDLDKYASSQTFYFNTSAVSNCSLFANNSIYASLSDVPADTNVGLDYNVTAPFTAAYPFRVECSDLNGTGVSSTKVVTFDTENPLSCPEGCLPVTDNSTIIDRGVSNISVFLQCRNTHLEQMNYSIGNSSVTLAEDSISMNATDYNVSFTLYAGNLSNGRYDVALSCFESPKVAVENYYFTITCAEVWTCSAWSVACDDLNPLVQTRTCVDSSGCGTETSKPSESQTCAVSGLPMEARFTPAATGLGIWSLFRELGRGSYSLFTSITAPLAILLLLLGLIGAIVLIIGGVAKWLG